MDPDVARDFLTQNHRGVLMTRRRDESIQASPVVATVDEDGRVLVSSRATAYKTKNLRHDPRASLVVFTDDFFGPWVQVDGTAEVIGLPGAMDLLIDYYRRIRGEHPDWADYKRAMEKERRVVLRISIARVGPSRTG